MDERFTPEVVEQLDENPVSDSGEFDCKPDWVRTEEVLQWLLPIIDEPSLGDHDKPANVYETYAMRQVIMAYGNVQKVKSVLCHYAKGEKSWSDPKAIGGIAREAQFFGYGADQERGNWHISLTPADCDYLLTLMTDFEPRDVVHKKARGSSLLPSGEILLVHGRSFFEYLDGGIYRIKLRPGLSVPAGVRSEEAERVHKVMLDYFAHRARAEGMRDEILAGEEADTGD